MQGEEVWGQNGLPPSRFDAPGHVVQTGHVQSCVIFRGVEAYMLEVVREGRLSQNFVQPPEDVGRLLTSES